MLMHILIGAASAVVGGGIVHVVHLVKATIKDSPSGNPFG